MAPSARKRKSATSQAKGADLAERRIIRIITWMKERTEPFSRDDLVEAFPREYTGSPAAIEKKFLRDKAVIERLGIALRLDEGEATSYLVDRTALHLARIDFERGEAAVVWMAGRAAARAAGHPLAAELTSALRKLVVGTGGLPATVPGPGALAPPPESKALGEWLELLADAVQRRRRLHLDYQGGSGAATVRDVDVFGYGLRDGDWFFVGHCHLRGAPRIFFLRRVVSMQAGRDPGHDCAVPKDAKGGDFTVPRDFDFDGWKTQRPWDYLAHPPIEAVVRLMPLTPEPAPDTAVPFRVINIGGGQPVGLLDFIETLEAELGLTALRNLLPMQPGDVPRTFASPVLLEQLTGYRPSTPLSAGVKAFADWYRDYYNLK